MQKMRFRGEHEQEQALLEAEERERLEAAGSRCSEEHHHVKLLNQSDASLNVRKDHVRNFDWTT